MKRKLLQIVLIVNTIALVIYYVPVLQSIFNITVGSDAGAIGIIGGVDGPTAIFISVKNKLVSVILILIEIIVGAYVFFTRSKR